MPTDLPPDYKPQPTRNPDSPADPAIPGSKPAYPPAQGDDSRDPSTGTPNDGTDAVDPPAWPLPPIVPGEPAGIPAPAGTPTF